MLKLPKVGKGLKDYKFISIVNNNTLELTIVYKITNKYNVLVHKMQNYVFRPDTNYPDVNKIKTNIDSMLNKAYGRSRCTISLFSARDYITVNADRYSGVMVL